jgi:iron complex outermembrane recepter protein
MNCTAFSRPSPARRIAIVSVLLCLGGLARPAGAQEEPVLPPPGDLKKMSVEELLDMEVTSVSKVPEKLLDAASAIQVITGDDIERAGATSIPEALRLASNLEVAQIDSNQWAITARGFNNLFADKLLVLMDGRSVYTPLYAGVYWDVQDTMLEDVDRIEVISGPGATQWGANAVNGVINITTKGAKDTQGGLVFAGGGTTLSDISGMRYGGELAPNVYYRVYAQYTERGDSLTPEGGNGDDAWHIGQTGFRMDWDAATGSVLTFQGDAYEATMGQAGLANIQATGANLLGRWTDQVSENSDIRVQLYYDYTHRRIPGSFTQDLGTYDSDFQYHVRLGTSNDIVSGFGYRREQDDIINTPAEAFLPPDVGQNFFNAFAQDDITLVKDRWHLIAGSKIEHNDYTGFEFEPSVRVAWTPTSAETVWAAVSRAVRTPSRIDVDLYSPATPPYRIAGGPDVVSEKLIAYELGYRVQVNPRLALSVSSFYNDYTDLRSLEPLDPPQPFPVEISSGLQGTSVGAEFTADWRVAPSWRLRAGYTDLRVHTEDEPGTVDRDSDRSISHDPNQQMSLHSLWDITSRWQLDADSRYVGPISNQSVPGYTELNLRLGWRPISALDLSADGQNLLHGKHAEFNTTGTRREIPRGFYGKATWHF